MTDNTKPEALDLADWLEAVGGGPSAKRCAALLREQHTRIAELESELEGRKSAWLYLHTENNGLRDENENLRFQAAVLKKQIRELEAVQRKLAYSLADFIHLSEQETVDKARRECGLDK